MDGKEHITLVEKLLAAGEHAVEWENVQVNPGVYFYRLQVDDLVAARKCIILQDIVTHS